MRDTPASTPIPVLYITDSTAYGGDTRSDVDSLRLVGAPEFDATAVCPASGPTHENISKRSGAWTVLGWPLGADRGASWSGRLRGGVEFVGNGARVVARALRQRPKVVFVGDRPRPLAVAWASAAASRARLLYHPQFYFVPGGLNARLRRGIARRADAVICHSQHSAESYKAIGVQAQRLSVLYNSTDVDRFQPGDGVADRRALGIPADTFVVGTTSVMRPWKGHDILMDAFADLAARYDDMHLLLGGDGPLRAELEQRCRELGIDDRTTFTGFRDDPSPLYRALDVFVLPSIEEPFGLVTIEAMACERPVVGTRSGGTIEIVDEFVTGLLVTPGDPSLLAASIESLYLDRELAREYGRAGRRRVLAHFDIQKRAEAMADEIRSLAGGH